MIPDDGYDETGESPIEGFGEEEIDRWMGRLYQEQAAQIAALQAENARLKTCLFKTAKDLKRAVKYWRDYAANDYHQTYNPERGKGLRIAADDLENYVYDAWGRNDVPSK